MSSKKSDISYADPYLPNQRALWPGMLWRNLWVPIALVILYFLGRQFEFADKPGPYAIRVVMLVGINITLAVSLQLINGISGQFSLGHAGFMAIGAYLGGYATSAFGVVETDEDVFDFANPIGVLLYFAILTLFVVIVSALLLGIFFLVRRARRIHNAFAGILALALAVWFVVDISHAYKIEKPPPYVVWYQTISLIGNTFERLTTWSHEFSLRSASSIPLAYARPTTFLIALLGGGLIASIAGLIVGLPTLRLRGDYLAIATLGFAEIIRVAIVNSQALGGATGLSVPVYWIPPEPEDKIEGYYLLPWVYGVAVMTTLLVWRIKHSPKGKSLAAVREDEVAAAAIGIDTTHHKVISFVIGAFFAGIAGALYAHYDGYLNTNSFGFMRSVELVVMVTLGGLGLIWGAVVAAIVLTILPEILRNIDALLPEWVPSDVIAGAEYVADRRMVFYALLLILLMLLRGRRWDLGWWKDRIKGFQVARAS